MPRPKNKTELLHLSRKNFEDLNRIIDSLPENEQDKVFPEGTLNRNIRDVLGHLHQWHLMMLHWYEVGMQGQKPEMPLKGYSWTDTPLLNKKIWEDNRHIPLPEMRKLFEKSYQDIRLIIEKHTDEELFEKKKYQWTGSTSLGSYLVSASSSHYDWAIKLIKKALK